MPPTAKATEMQGADGGNCVSRGGQQTAEPAETMETAEDNGSMGPWQEQSDGARSKHGALARCVYDILVSEATEGGQSNLGVTGGEDGYTALSNREGTGT